MVINEICIFMHITRFECVRRFLLDHFHHLIVESLFLNTFGREIDWVNPKDINEKIQWIIRYGDTSVWPLCSDKYRVREFVAERGLGHLLVKLYGVWDDAKKINFESLPDKFVLKCNHDSGSCYIVDKKAGYDSKKIVEDLNQHLKIKYGYVHGEMWYNKIKPLVIAEEFLNQDSDSWTTSLVDYKIWCFDGKPYSIWTCYSRSSEGTYVNLYDLDWNVHPEVSVFTEHYKDGKGMVPKPDNLDEMLDAASILSKGFPEVRTDFYSVAGKLYFGELTFASLCGLMDFFTKDYLEELGDQVILPPKKGWF